MLAQAAGRGPAFKGFVDQDQHPQRGVLLQKGVDSWAEHVAVGLPVQLAAEPDSDDIAGAAGQELDHSMPLLGKCQCARGPYMITATPARQTRAPMMSQRSGRNPSSAMPQASEPATNTPP